MGESPIELDMASTYVKCAFKQDKSVQWPGSIACHAHDVNAMMKGIYSNNEFSCPQSDLGQTYTAHAVSKIVHDKQSIAFQFSN